MATEQVVLTVNASRSPLRAYVEYERCDGFWHVELKSLEVWVRGPQHIDILAELCDKAVEHIVAEITEQLVRLHANT